MSPGSLPRRKDLRTLRRRRGRGSVRARDKKNFVSRSVVFTYSHLYRNRIRRLIIYIYIHAACGRYIYSRVRLRRRCHRGRFKGLSMRPCRIDAKLFDLFLKPFRSSFPPRATESRARRARVDLSNIITRARSWIPVPIIFIIIVGPGKRTATAAAGLEKSRAPHARPTMDKYRACSGRRVFVV